MQHLRSALEVPPLTANDLRPLAKSSARSEARRLERRRVYLGEGLTVRVEAEGLSLACEVIDITPEGMGLAVLDGGELPDLADVVTIAHTGKGLEGIVHRARILSVTEGTFAGRRLPRLGVRFFVERTTDRATRDRRSGERFRCADAFPVMATAASPLFFREWLAFRVSELSAGGMTATTSLRNKALLPGMELSLQLTLPMTGTFEVRGQVASIARDVGDDAFRVGLRFLEPTQKLLHAMAEHLLLAEKSLSPARLREGGLAVGSIEKAVTYDYARPDEYEEILALRLRSHQQEGRLEEYATKDMESPFDAHSRHIVCRFGERLVGYVRLIYVGRDASKSQYVSAGGHEVPAWLWEAGFVEAGAGATDPTFQRAGLFLPLMQHCVRVGMQSGHRYMIGACDDELLPMYRAMGFTVLETREVEPKEGWKFRSHLFVLDMEELLQRTQDGKFVDAMAAAAEFATSR